MQELAKTASRGGPLDTQTVPVVGYYSPISNICVISNIRFFCKKLFSFSLSIFLSFFLLRSSTNFSALRSEI
jgi:hypothetical protein